LYGNYFQFLSQLSVLFVYIMNSQEHLAACKTPPPQVNKYGGPSCSYGGNLHLYDNNGMLQNVISWTHCTGIPCSLHWVKTPWSLGSTLHSHVVMLCCQGITLHFLSFAICGVDGGYSVMVILVSSCHFMLFCEMFLKKTGKIMFFQL